MFTRRSGEIGSLAAVRSRALWFAVVPSSCWPMQSLLHVRCYKPVITVTFCHARTLVPDLQRHNNRRRRLNSNVHNSRHRRLLINF